MAEKRRLALNRALGLAPSATIQLDPDIRLPAELSTPANLSRALDERRLDLLALKKGYESQDEKFRAAVLAQFPKINLGVSEARDAVVRPADLETEDRLQIFPLQQHGVAEPARQPRSRIERRLPGDFVDAAREDLAQQTVHAIFIR